MKIAITEYFLEENKLFIKETNSFDFEYLKWNIF